MASSNGHKHATEVETIVDNLMERLQDSMRDIVAQAVNDGAKIGGEAARRQLVDRLAHVDLPVGNDAGSPKRDRTLRGTVKCPVPSCKLPGSRQLHCFCKKHYDTLPAEKREELREAQLKKLQKQKQDALEKEMEARHNAA